ncbi:hypothetical protein DFH11DRAFT_1516248 [Phellopilus nigrolimitatus]|nr:hypothetical protein DFH11DRAFT_1516248 [Phellopilus nigrolimitatus]
MEHRQLTSPTRLPNLPVELIVHIFSFCSFDDVRNLGRTCRYLHNLHNARPVWISLLRNLDIDQAPAIPSYLRLESLSTKELKKTVIKAIRTSDTWHSHETLRVSQVMELRINTADPADLDGIDPRLLPGGQHVLLERRGQLELWSTNSRELVWTAPADSENHGCISFDFELVEDGKTLMVAGVFRDKGSSTNSTTISYARVFSYDFERKKGRLVIKRVLPATELFRLMIRGDFLLVHSTHKFHVLLVNWKTDSSVILSYSDQSGRVVNAPTALVGDQHIVVALDVNPLSLVALPLSSLAGRWSQSAHHAEWEVITIVPEALCKQRGGGAVLQLAPSEGRAAGTGPSVLALHAFSPSWRGADAPMEIHIVAYEHILSDQRTKRLHSYRVQLSRVAEAARGNAPCCQPADSAVSDGQWRLALIAQRTTITNYVPSNLHCIMNSGRMLSVWKRLVCFSLFPSEPQPVKIIELGMGIRLEEESTSASVEPWSGALTIGTPGLVRIVHF